MSLLSIFIILIIVFALLETPLFTVICGLSMVCFYFIDYDFLSLQMILIEMNRLASMPVLVALPLFVFVGCLLTETDAPKRIMNFMQAIVGWLPGGLAIAGLCACDFFTALTGASGVTVVAVGSLLYPILKQQNYEERFSLGLVATSGSIGQLLPPSLPIILYGVVAQVDINKIFKAAIIPTILMIIIMSIYAFFYQYFREKSAGIFVHREPLTFSNVKKTFFGAIWDWPIIIIIITGVYGGFVTIAEVSAVVLTYVIIVECFILKEIDFFKKLPSIMVESAMLSGAIIIILAVALSFTGFLVDEKIPNAILTYLTGITQNKYFFLIGLNLFFLVVGCIMDIFSAIIIVVPIMIPIALTYGIDPIHLGIIFLVNLEIGLSTPPIGINLFIVSLRFEKPLALIYRSSIPFLILLIISLILITYIPWLSLWLIN